MVMGSAWLLPIYIAIREVSLSRGRTFLRLLVPLEHAAFAICHKEHFHNSPRDGLS